MGESPGAGWVSAALVGNRDKKHSPMQCSALVSTDINP